MSNRVVLEIEGEDDPLPYKVKCGLAVEKAFAMEAEARAYMKTNLGKPYQLWKGCRLIGGKPYKEFVRGKEIYIGP